MPSAQFRRTVENRDGMGDMDTTDFRLINWDLAATTAAASVVSMALRRPNFATVYCPATVCCCPIIFFSFSVVDGFALHLDYGRGEQACHRAKVRTLA